MRTRKLVGLTTVSAALALGLGLPLPAVAAGATGGPAATTADTPGSTQPVIAIKRLRPYGDARATPT